jgi:hypothetical protein
MMKLTLNWSLAIQLSVVLLSSSGNQISNFANGVVVTESIDEGARQQHYNYNLQQDSSQQQQHFPLHMLAADVTSSSDKMVASDEESNGVEFLPPLTSIERTKRAIEFYKRVRPPSIIIGSLQQGR